MQEFAQIQNKTARLLFLINKLYEEEYILVEEQQLMKSKLNPLILDYTSKQPWVFNWSALKCKSISDSTSNHGLSLILKDYSNFWLKLNLNLTFAFRVSVWGRAQVPTRTKSFRKEKQPYRLQR